MSLKLSEIFYSLQGEGPMTGRPAFFIRTAGCNLNCGMDSGATWKCDTWDIMRSTKLEYTPKQLVDHLDSIEHTDYQGLGIRYIFTGGEPLLQAEALQETFEYMSKHYFNAFPYIDIETNGTIYNPHIFSKLGGYAVVSPKLSNSMIPESRRFDKDVLADIVKYSKHPIFKFVISNEQDVEEVLDKYVPILGARWKQITWFIPGMDRLKDSIPVKQFVWNTCMKHQVPMAIRAHIEVFDKKAGV